VYEYLYLFCLCFSAVALSLNFTHHDIFFFVTIKNYRFIISSLGSEYIKRFFYLLNYLPEINFDSRRMLNSLNLVERLITSRYLFLCVWISLSVLFMFFSCCIVIKLHPSWHIFLCAILFIYNNIYNLTPVELNSDELKFRLSRIKVLVPRCRKPYYLHSLSQIYLSKLVYYLGIKIGSQVTHRSIQ
jgi:hypothetical protein